MDDNCGEWVECTGVASECGEQEAGVASGSGWNLWVCLVGVVVRRYIDFLILLIPTPLFFAAASLLFVHFLNVFHSCIYIYSYTDMSVLISLEELALLTIILSVQKCNIIILEISAKNYFV